MNIRFKLTGALALLSALLIGCSGTPGGSSSDVTLSGVISTGSAAAAVAGGVKKTTGGVTAATLSGYSLYCVTFTNPPQSGTGALTGPDGSGNYSYSVTLTDAAGLPIGCFITDSTNTPVSTVTFNVSDSTGLSGDSSGAALGGGSHTVNISFDPDTGASTATITSSDLDSSGSASSTDAATQLATMAGAWNMSCTDADPGYTNGQVLTPAEYSALSACQQMLMTNYDHYDSVAGTDIYSWNGSGAMPIYLNFVSGIQDGTTPVYAMGVWPSLTQFTSCGSTEGMSSTALGYHNVTVSGQTSATGNPVGNFTNIHNTLVGAGAGNYDVVQDIATGDVNVSGNLGTIQTTLNASYPYNSNFDDSNGNWCDTGTDGLTSFGLDTDQGRKERSCYADFMGWSMQDRARNGDTVAACAPILASNTLYQTIWNWDPTLNTGLGGYTNTNANITVPFRTNLGGISPEIGGRYALMGLELLSGSAIANDHHEDQWNYWDGTQDVSCKFVEDLSINMVPAADGLSAIGHFTVKDWQGCKDPLGNPVSSPGAGDSYATFDVNFAR